MIAGLTQPSRLAALRAQLKIQAPGVDWKETRFADGSVAFSLLRELPRGRARARLMFVVEPDPTEDSWHLVVCDPVTHPEDPFTLEMGDGHDVNIRALVKRIEEWP